MNKHTKTALIVAPFLILGGYILSDMYLENQAQQQKVIALTQHNVCNVMAKDCILESGDLKLNVYEEDGLTMVNSTFQLDDVTLFIVPDANDPVSAQSYPLTMDDNPFYWNAKTTLSDHIQQKGDGVTLRVIATIKGGRYISEFYAERY